MANRSEHVEKILKPEIKSGKTMVLCDRFYMSTMVYQGENNPERQEIIKQLQNLVSDITPTITFFIDIDEKTFEDRYKNRGANTFDEDTKKNFNIIRERYLNYYEKNKDKEKIVYLSGELDISMQINTIKNHLNLLF